MPADGQFLRQFSSGTRPPLPTPKKEFPLGMDNTVRSRLQRCPLRIVVARRAVLLQPRTTHGPPCRCLPPEGSRFYPPSTRSQWEVERGPGKFSIRRGDTLRHDRAGVPGCSLGHAEVPAGFERPPIIPPPHGSSAAHPDPQRLQLGQTRQRTNPASTPKNAALCIHSPLDPWRGEFNGRRPLAFPYPHRIFRDELAEGPTSFSTRVALISIIDGSYPCTSDPLLDKVSAAAAVDPVMIALRDVIRSGFPNEKCNLPLPHRHFWCVRSLLAIDKDDDIIVMGCRVVIPEAVCREVLKNFILMHQGETKLRQRARQTMYWPSMDSEIITAARACPTCTEHLPSHPPEPLLPHQKASRPFEFIHADLGCHNGRDFLILADQFSGWPHVVPFPDKNTSACKVVDAVHSFFSFDAGAPIKFWSDGGPHFTADEFQSFLREWGISHGTSSAGYPQSNGFAEVSVKSMKKLIRGSWSAGSFDMDQFSKGLLLYRNAPLSGGASPAQLVFNRPVRDCFPAHRHAFAPQWQKSAVQLENQALRARTLRAAHFNLCAHPLPPFSIGDSVVIQNHLNKRWSTPSIIVETGPFRDYLIKTPAGRLFRRNRRLLRRHYPSVTPAPSVHGQLDRPAQPSTTSTPNSPTPDGPAAPTAEAPRRSARIRNRSNKN